MGNPRHLPVIQFFDKKAATQTVQVPREECSLPQILVLVSCNGFAICNYRGRFTVSRVTAQESLLQDYLCFPFNSDIHKVFGYNSRQEST